MFSKMLQVCVSLSPTVSEPFLLSCSSTRGNQKAFVPPNWTPCGPVGFVVEAATDDFRRRPVRRLKLSPAQLLDRCSPSHTTYANHITDQSLLSDENLNFLKPSCLPRRQQTFARNTIPLHPCCSIIWLHTVFLLFSFLARTIICFRWIFVLFCF